ncbi:hypothetical protein COLO4_38039 [Corchorus olitorius]|uniref:Uncharacterized protein n=1 Tax=Corchorus olitorius TaxID=93759 RepID=A0A1R3FXF6_9ROSI|nr:hypothetical protein COLO4_38039 [Corchorus olitorius]
MSQENGDGLAFVMLPSSFDVSVMDNSSFGISPGVEKSISETRIGREEEKEDSVNKQRGGVGRQGRDGQPLLKLKAARDNDDIPDFQDDTDGLSATNKELVKETHNAGESQIKLIRKGPVSDSHVGAKKKAISKEFNGSQDVMMEDEVATKGDKNFVFKAANESSNTGGGSKTNKKWKRVAVTGFRKEKGSNDQSHKVSGKKREGSNGALVEVRKKSMEDGLAVWNKSIYGSLELKIDKLKREISAFYEKGKKGRNLDDLNALLSELIELEKCQEVY